MPDPCPKRPIRRHRISKPEDSVAVHDVKHLSGEIGFIYHVHFTTGITGLEATTDIGR